jgi:two-component sensor histidine kinase
VINAMNRSLERLRQEEARSAALARDRETLFKELQHRISNNLGIVSALLNLQRADVEDPKAKHALTEAATRLQLIAKIHRKLHDPAGAQLRFGPFLEDLCRDILEASGARNIVCLVTAADAQIAPERTIPLALIVTELISNALEHGFEAGRPGTIRIDFAPERPGSREQVLTVSDDGAGLPDGFSLENATGLGLRIVKSLTRQLDGRLVMETAGGTTCRLVFPA